MAEIDTTRYLLSKLGGELFTSLLYYDKLIFTENRPEPHMGLDLEPLMQAQLLVYIYDLLRNEPDALKMARQEIPESEKVSFDCKTQIFRSYDGTVLKREEALALIQNKWFRETKNILQQIGYNVAVHYPAYPDFANEFKSGRTDVVGIIFSRLPQLDARHVNVETLLDFIKDAHTQKLKRRLFVWQNDIETQIETGALKIEHLPELIATRLDDYTEWIKKSELKLKYGIYESILLMASPILAALLQDLESSLLMLPVAATGLIKLRKHGIDLEQAELQAPGPELAYIFHANRRFL